MDDQIFRLLVALRAGAKNATDLLRELNMSQPSFSRLISRAGGAVQSIGRARATLYASSRDLRGLGPSLPIFRVTAQGVIHPWGQLGVLSAGQFGLETPMRPNGQLIDRLPCFLQDMRPQGFLGQMFPKSNPELHLPDRIDDWNDDDTLYALARRGEDCVGDLIVGNESLERFYLALTKPAVLIEAHERQARYQELAEAALTGAPPGSSVGGEQPKFTATVVRSVSGVAEAVLVKFSPADKTAVGTRWRDLLIAEHCALETIRESGFDAARSELVEAGNRVFLEVVRFDRIGIHGRCSVISLGALDDELFGKKDGWIQAAARLEAAKLISHGDANALRFQAVFGKLIGNTDQHFGNISFKQAEQCGPLYRLAPAYDVLPMLYAPINGEIVPRVFKPPMPSAETISIWPAAAESACRYWRGLGGDHRLSDDFRQIALENAEILEKLAPIATSLSREVPEDQAPASLAARQTKPKASSDFGM